MFGWEGVVKAEEHRRVGRRIGVKYDLRVQQVPASVLAIVGGPVKGWFIFNSLNLFGCLATLIKFVSAPVVVPAN